MKKVLFVYAFLALIGATSCNHVQAYLNTATSGNKSEQKKETNPDTASSQIMSESELIAHFNKHKSEFDSLRIWIQNDDLEFMSTELEDKRHLDNISQERADKYFELMRNISINTIARGNKYAFNTVIFYFPTVKKNDDLEINMGYEYRIDTTKTYNDWIKTTNDIFEEADKLEKRTFVYKPIEEHWSMVCLNL